MSTTDPRALDGVTRAICIVAERDTHDSITLTFTAPKGAGVVAGEALRSLVNGALHNMRNPFVTTRMEQPPTDANGMPVEDER